MHTNNEVQEYTNASHNLQITGGQTLQIIPRKSASGAWTSGRIETQAAFAPAANTTTLVEASIRFGGHAAAAKQGLWPAFWLLGDSMRHGTAWPACGELDVLEMINGRPTGYGTAHCAACGGPAFAQGSVAVPDNDWHAWSLVVDRSRYGAAGWTAETITWWRDGALFHELAGGDVDEATWATLAHSPLYIILNVAVGGDW